MSNQQVKRIWEQYSVFIAFAIVFIAACAIGKGDFWSSANLFNVLHQASFIGIVALGQCIVILTGGLDLSVGSVVALAGGFGLIAMNASNPFWGFLATLGIGVLVGVVNGFIVTKWRIAPFVVTLGTMSIARSLILYRSQAGTVSANNQTFVSNFGGGTLFGIYYTTYIFIICAILLTIVLKKTRFGRYIYAIGSNERATLLSAIRVDRVKLFAYILCGLLAALAAFLEATHLGAVSSSTEGSGYELDSIAAVVLGGTRLNGGKGTIWGTFVGVLIMAILNNIINLVGVDSNLQGLVKGAIIIIAVLLQKKD